MDIDKRLQALTQSLELLASMPRDGEQRLERVEAATERVAKGSIRLEGLVTQIAEGTARLLHVAERHERRISDLERSQAQ